MVWETALDAAHSEARHFLGDRPGLLQEVISELESQFIILQESHICLPNRSMAAICLRRSLPVGNSMWRPATAWGSPRRRKGCIFSGKSAFSPAKQ